MADYTQADVDKIVNDVKTRQQEKFNKRIEKEFVPLNKYQELEKNLNALNSEIKVKNFKDVFLSNGGKNEAYEDFIMLNRDILDLSSEEQIKKFNEFKENKPYFFEQNENNINSFNERPLPDGEQVIKSMLQDEQKHPARVSFLINDIPKK